MKKLTTEEFIQKAKLAHGDKYDYSLVDYKNVHAKIKIICPEHGEYMVTPANHIFRKVGCSECNNFYKSNKKDFIKKSNKIYDNFFNYDLVEYKDYKTKVKIICPVHGTFEQSPKQHFKNIGCSKCKNEINISNSLDNFKKKASEIHNDEYDYSKSIYKSSNSKIIISCRKHGFFEQRVDHHLSGSKCPKCKSIISKPEIELQDFIKSLGFKIKTNDRKMINPYELDIYIPELKKAIEFNGEYWHYECKNCKPKGYHSTKSKLCKSLNINLLHIREDLWKKDKEKMKKVIHKFLEYEI